VNFASFTLVAIVAAVVPNFAAAEAKEAVPDAVHEEAEPAIAKDFCSSFLDVAAERRNARLIQDLQRNRDALAEAIEELDEKAAQLKTLIDVRKSMQEKVSDSILKIYLQVEPEAAAQQLTRLEPTTAAEILLRMNAKRSGEILTLMEPKRAASLVAILTLQTPPNEETKP
jgi:flagellar motility protein MotE (MotC chaperone)